jgi:hypothetical protein
MKTITLHPTSLLVGVALAILGLVTMGQKLVPTAPDIVRVAVVGPVDVPPLPSDYVEILEGAPFVVPVGQLLFVTALGTDTTGGLPTWMEIDGSRVITVDRWEETIGSSMQPVPAGLVAQSGSVVEIFNIFGNPTSRAWGYLAPDP